VFDLRVSRVLFAFQCELRERRDFTLLLRNNEPESPLLDKEGAANAAIFPLV
jgi:hypothetical protein